MANRNPKLENLTQKGLGRPRGSKNKFTSLKDAFLNAFEEIGGQKELASWAKQQKNRAVFYQIIAKMLPNKTELEGEIEHTRETKVIFEVVNENLTKPEMITEEKDNNGY